MVLGDVDPLGDCDPFGEQEPRLEDLGLEIMAEVIVELLPHARG